jgi:hypothetical protein
MILKREAMWLLIFSDKICLFRVQLWMSVGGCKDYTDLGGPEVGTTDY